MKGNRNLNLDAHANVTELPNKPSEFGGVYQTSSMLGANIYTNIEQNRIFIDGQHIIYKLKTRNKLNNLATFSLIMPIGIKSSGKYLYQYT